jgi:hypothetical protein
MATATVASSCSTPKPERSSACGAPSVPEDAPAQAAGAPAAPRAGSPGPGLSQQLPHPAAPPRGGGLGRRARRWTGAAPPLETEGPGPQQFGSPVHSVNLQRRTAVCRGPSRIGVQVFDPDGKYQDADVRQPCRSIPRIRLPACVLARWRPAVQHIWPTTATLAS